LVEDPLSKVLSHLIRFSKQLFPTLANKVRVSRYNARGNGKMPCW